MHSCSQLLHKESFSSLENQENMESLSLVLATLLILSVSSCNAANSKLFREYIGAEFNGVRLSEVPINSGVDFHFILSFAIDYSDGNSPSPTNGKFNIFWDTDHLNPAQVSSIKNRNPNVKVAVSLGGDSVGSKKVHFEPHSVSSWVTNAVSSVTKIIKQYHLDGIDIDYEHYRTDPKTFAECIGQLISRLKKDGTISFASIAPYADSPVQSHYLALWREYGHVIDYVNFQFYAYDSGISVSQFLKFFDEQASNYGGGQILVSFISDGSGGLSPDNGFFDACKVLKKKGRLGGIFVWSADVSKSKKNGFEFEKQSQKFLA